MNIPEEEDKRYQIEAKTVEVPPGKGAPNSSPPFPNTEPPATNAGRPPDRQRIRIMLRMIPTEYVVDDESWRRVGNALFNAGYALDLWEEWSERRQDHNPELCQHKWLRFNRDGDKTLGIGTIREMMRDDGLIYSGRGTLRAGASINVKILLRDSGRRFRRNVFSTFLEVDGERMSEEILRELKEWLQIEYEFVPTAAALRDGVGHLCDEDSYDPMQVWLKGLAWDGVERLHNMAVMYFGCPADSPNDWKRYQNEVAALLVRGIVGRQLEPGCAFDYMVVLRSSKEGVGKSRALHILAGGSDYYTGSLSLNVFDLTKHVLEKSRGKVLVVSEELAGLSGADIGKLKGIITELEDVGRTPYATYAETHKRRFILASTTNETHILKDPGDNRRFPILECGEVDLEGLARDREQLFAEAFKEWESGAITLPQDLWAFQRSVVDRYKVSSDLREALRPVLEGQQGWFYASDLTDFLRSRDIRAANQHLSRELTLYFDFRPTRRRNGGERHRVWTNQGNLESDQRIEFPSNMALRGTDGTDVYHLREKTHKYRISRNGGST